MTPEHEMLAFSSILNWFAGGTDHPYMTLYHCMQRDTLWVSLTVGLDAAVAVGYGVITVHWWRNGRNLPDVPARRALANIRNIFIFCCICGYMFIPIKMVWPAWRLYDVFLAVLAYFTWKYAWGARDLKVVYTELGKTVQLTADLEKSREESRRKTAFLNALSHDLRTPVNAISLQAEVARIAAETRDADMTRHAMSQIEANSRAIAGLLETLLEYAQLDWQQEPNHVDTFVLMDLVRNCLLGAESAAAEKGLYLQVGETDLVLRTDRTKLERILNNLLSNAVKFTEKGGVRIAVEQAGGAMELHVIDSGIGLSTEQQVRLFEEFYQAGNYERDRQKGFGLGLAISRRLARQLGGDITIDSAPRGGSRFTVALPHVVVGRGDKAANDLAPALVAGNPSCVGG
jgi:signal transduction histidine kinase